MKKRHIIIFAALIMIFVGVGMVNSSKKMNETKGLGIVLPELDENIVVDSNKTLHRRQACWIGYSFEKTIEKSSFIVRGTVTEKSETKIYDNCDSKGEVVGQTAYREVTIEVLESLKGAENKETITYLELGGETDDAIYVYEGITPLNIGDEYLFFLNEYGAFWSPETVMPISEEYISPVSRLIPENFSNTNTYGTTTRISVDSYINAIKEELD